MADATDSWLKKLRKLRKLRKLSFPRKMLSLARMVHFPWKAKLSKLLANEVFK